MATDRREPEDTASAQGAAGEAGAAADRLLIDLLVRPREVVRERVEAVDAAQWARIVARASDHRCLPCLDRSLTDTGLGNLAPAPTMAALARRRAGWTRRALGVARECARIHHVLATAGIAHLFLKGVPLALDAYPQPWLRPMRDIDVLVAPGDAQRAHALLARESAEGTPGSLPDMAGPRGTKHLSAIRSPAGLLPVEVHDRLVPSDPRLPTTGPQILADAAWRDATTVMAGGTALPVPGREVTLVHLIIHGLLDHELNNGPLFAVDLVHWLRCHPPGRARLDTLAQALQLEGALSLTAALLPDEQAAHLEREAGGAVPASWPDEAMRLMLQPVRARGELKLAATLAEATLAGRLRMLARRLARDRETMRNAWVLSGRPLEEAPRSTALLRAWFIAERARAVIGARDDTGGEVRQALLSLRRNLRTGAG